MKRRLKVAALALAISPIFLLGMKGPLSVYAAEEAALEAPEIKKDEPAAPPVAPDKERDSPLQAGDKINVKIYPEDAYVKGGEFQISPEGNIMLSLLGKVNVAGMTIEEASEKLRQLIDKDYLVDPEVAIELMESKQKSFVILGEVKKPGTYQFPTGSATVSLLEAISTAGGFSDIANIKKIRILRQEGTAKRTLHANAEAIISGNEPDVSLQEGDVVNVSESLF